MPEPVVKVILRAIHNVIIMHYINGHLQVEAYSRTIRQCDRDSAGALLIKTKGIQISINGHQWSIS